MLRSFLTHRLTRLAAAVCVVAGLALAAFHREIPAWRIHGTASLATASVGFEGGAPLCSGPGQTIELRGDSLVVGGRMDSDTGEPRPYGEVMAQALGDGTQVVLHGRGSATAVSGVALWGNAAPQGDIVLLAYGTNDAAARGWIGGKAQVPINAFRDSLVQHVRLARQRGARVGLMAPPPVGAPAMMDRLQPYRVAVGQIGRQEGIPVFDPVDAFAECREQEPLLSRDALHLNATGHACLGRWLARRLCGRQG